jgi:hypothetical protein
MWKSRAFRQLYRISGCQHHWQHKTKEWKLAVYLCIFFPMEIAKDEWLRFFDLLPGLKDSEWEELLVHMHG